MRRSLALVTVGHPDGFHRLAIFKADEITHGSIHRSEFAVDLGQCNPPALREFLAELRVSVPVSRLAKWKTTLQLVALGALILGGALPAQEWVHSVGLASLWAAAALTLVTGYDYLRIGLKHMD